jgi:hypothetical protein
MTEQEAFSNISQVCALYKGTLAEHNAIQESLSILKPKVTKNEEFVEATIRG